MTLIINSIFVSGLLTLFCTTKVSEWVLQNVEPENYQLIFSHKKGEGAAFMASNKKVLEDIEDANIIFRDVENEKWGEPSYTLLYRNRAIKRYTSPEEIKNLTKSAVRDRIYSEIMAGKLCVMLLLKCENEEKNLKAQGEVLKTLKQSPFNEIISFLELSKNNAEEMLLVSMLLNVEPDLKGINEPMLFGIFGKFRALEPLVAGGITGENVNLMISFLTADCSCLIKDDLPGADILYTTGWENPVSALVNKILDENPSLIHR